jgi:hypothetical protein
MRLRRAGAQAIPASRLEPPQERGPVPKRFDSRLERRARRAWGWRQCPAPPLTNTPPMAMNDE